VTFISIHSVIIYVVFFGACMRCTRLCSLKPGVTKALGISFYRYKEVIQLYIWGCSYVLTWPTEKCLSHVEA
jgi:Fe-S cluster biogenesis protein NfuA